jgi:hypothetical protein
LHLQLLYCAIASLCYGVPKFSFQPQEESR